MAAASSSRSTKWSCSRLTSSTYRIPRCASASRPGSNAFTPSASARSMSSAPTSRSSEAPTGSSTIRAGRAPAPPDSCGPSGQAGSGAAGSQENRQPETTSTSGISAERARTAVDLAVPFSPRTSTPPTARRDGVQQQGEPQIVLPDDRGERVGGAHSSPSKSPSSCRYVARSCSRVSCVGLGPQPAVRRLQQPLRDAAQRPRVGLLHELPVLRVEHVLRGQASRTSSRPPPRPSRRTRTGSPRSRPSRTRPCSRAAASPPSSAGSPPAPGRPGASPRPACGSSPGPAWPSRRRTPRGTRP